MSKLAVVYATRKEPFMFLIVLFILAALAFPPCLITAITLRVKDDERAIRYTIASSLSFAATVFLFGFAMFYLF